MSCRVKKSLDIVMNSNATLETLWSYCEGAKLLTLAEEKKMDGFPLPHTQFKQVFVLLTLGRVTPTTKALYRTNRKICWPLSMIDKTGLSPLQPCVV